MKRFEHEYTAISIVTFNKELITETNEILVILNENYNFNIRKPFYIYLHIFKIWVVDIYHQLIEN
jgi:hypothetical protein